jgi:hypothetical protein
MHSEGAGKIDMDDGMTSKTAAGSEPESSLSYKFQRLREKLRDSIASGDLAGKLPGERALAKRFHVNAKTLSKALTDLAAEGLLDRSIGRGTFVKGSAPAVGAAKRWLVICNPDQADCELVQLLRQAREDLDVLTDVSSVRPSFLNQFSAVILLGSGVSDSFIRDLVVRNVAVVVVGREPQTYSTHAVVFDSLLAVSMLARDLLLKGHRRIAAVEAAQCTRMADILRESAVRYAPQAIIDACFPPDAYALVNSGITALACDSVETAAEVTAQLQSRGINIPAQVSVAAVGATADDPAVSGYFMRRTEMVNAIVMLLQQHSVRPTTIWLAGKFIDRGTMDAIGCDLEIDPNSISHGTAV